MSTVSKNTKNLITFKGQPDNGCPQISGLSLLLNLSARLNQRPQTGTVQIGSDLSCIKLGYNDSNT